MYRGGELVNCRNMWNAFAFCLSVVGFQFAEGAEPVRVAVIEILSSPGALLGKWWANHAHFAVEQLNANGGVLGGRKVEALFLDNKGSPQEALIALKTATDQGVRFVFGAAGSHIGIALSEAIAKFNERNPDKAVLFLNYGSLAPELTNEKCNFWHFRFDSHSDMRVAAIARQIAKQKSIKKVYLINQDYAYGQAVRLAFKDQLPRLRPDIEIVGDDLIQLQKTKDFAPYVAKIKSSGADAVLTGNWGPDLILMLRAGHEYGLSARYYTLTAHFPGTATAIGEAGAEKLVNTAFWHPNIADAKLEKYYLDYKKQYKEEWNALPIKNAFEMWAKAINSTQSVDPREIAKVLESMKYDSGTGTMWMRAEDHQLMLPQYTYIFAKAGQPGVKYDAENSGYGWRTEARFEADETVQPHTCKMHRP
jgi:branched-chain amino acid transport system substrate-binding protein